MEIISLSEVAKRYPSDINYIGSLKGQTNFCLTDFYFLEPYGFELQNLDAKVAQFISIDEARASGGSFFSYFRVDNKMYLKREYLGGEVYYDTLYFYQENTTLSYCVYVSPDKIVPYFTQKLSFNESGPERFIEKYKAHGRELNYDFKADRCKISERRFGKGGSDQLVDYLVSLSDKGVEKIVSDESGQKTVVYDSAIVNLRAEEYKELFAEGLSNHIYESLSKLESGSDKVACLLLEYNLQGPFPPTLGLGTEKERSELIPENEEVFCFFNSPDFELYSENGLEIPFYTEGLSPIYSAFNAKFNCHNSQLKQVLEREGLGSLADFIFSIYLDICKRLKDKGVDKLLSVSDDFIILARDFEECNEDRFLKALLSEEEYDHWMSFSGEPLDPFSEEDKKTIKWIKETIQNITDDYPKYAQLLSQFKGEVNYSLSKPFELSPLEFEIENNSLNKLEEIEKPDNFPYYEYGVRDKKVVYHVNHLSENEIVLSFYTYDDNKIELKQLRWNGNQNVEGDRFAILTLDNDKWSTYESSDGFEYLRKKAIYKEGRLAGFDQYRTLYASVKVDGHSRFEVEQDDQGVLKMITSKPVSKSAMNRRPYVHYSIDDGYIEKEGQWLFSALAESLATQLAQLDIQGEEYDALILEYSERLSYPPYVHLGRVNKEGDAATDYVVDGYSIVQSSQADLRLNLFTPEVDATNFGAYTLIRSTSGCGRLPDHQASEKIFNAYVFLCRKLQKMDLKIPKTKEFKIFAFEESKNNGQDFLRVL